MIKYWTEDLKPAWIQHQITSDTVDWARKFGSHLARKGDMSKPDPQSRDKRAKIRKTLTTSQLRKFFGELKRIKAAGYGEGAENTDFILLEPLITYTAAKADDSDAKIHDFKEQLVLGIKAVKGQEAFLRFVKIVEAVVAFHREMENSPENK